MTTESDEAAISEAVSKGRTGFLPVIGLSVLLGIVLIAGVIAAVLSNQNFKALRSELSAMKKEVAAIKKMNEPSENSPALETALKDMKLQIETLSGQISALTASVTSLPNADMAADKSAAGGDKASDSVAGGTVEQPSPMKEKPPQTPVPLKTEAAQKKIEAQDCNLIGKSPEDQAAILKRCVSLIDPPDEKRKP